MTGNLIGIAVRPARLVAMETRDSARVSTETGVDGDHAGKRPDRLVTVLSKESWEDARVALKPPLKDDEELSWLTRRANFLVSGVRLPRATGGVIKIGDVKLEITGQTHPCGRMEEYRKGLLKALAPEWRGGVTCKVLKGGDAVVGDKVEVLVALPEAVRKLP